MLTPDDQLTGSSSSADDERLTLTIAGVYLARRGRRVVALIDAPDDLDRIVELAEDMPDIRAAEAARARCKRLAKPRSRGSRSRPISA